MATLVLSKHLRYIVAAHFLDLQWKQKHVDVVGNAEGNGPLREPSVTFICTLIRITERITDLVAFFLSTLPLDLFRFVRVTAD